MPRLIMLDHSLKGVGGHHYDYALNVLRAADEAGLEIVLGTHVKLRSPPDFPKDWRVFPVFRLSAYADYSVSRVIDGLDCDQEVFLARPIAPWRRWWDAILDLCDRSRFSSAQRRAACAERHYLRGRWPKIQAFARECGQFFRQIKWNRDDIVFVPTLTEFDLERLVGFLSKEPASRNATWHLQFHWNFLDGREPDYLRQAKRLEAMRRYFHDLLAQIPQHKVFLYATTLPLCKQYDQLQVAQFKPLSYPVNESLSPPLPGRSQERLRVTTAGCVRLEKGCHHIEPLIRDLWDNYFQAGRLQLVVQADRKHSAIKLPRGGKPLLVNSVNEANHPQTPVACIRARLPVDEYASLIQSTDIGLFLYDSERYYTRCSGVLVEMLAAGVPVIVPAGCWLSEQIAEEIYEYRDRLAKDLPTLKVVSLGDAANRPEGEENSRHFVELLVPKSATHLLVAVHQALPIREGVFVRVAAEALDLASQPLKPFAEIVGSRADGKPSSAMIPVRANAARILLSLTNAYGPGELPIADAQFRFLSDADVPGGIPAGSVGLIAAGSEQIADLLEEMTAHYSHYRDSAREFSPQWRHAHHPERTVEALLANSGLAQPKMTSAGRKVA